MAVDIDSLQIEIEATSSDAAAKIDALATALTNLKTAAKGGAGLTTVSKQMQALANAAKLINSSSLNTAKLKEMTSALNGLSSIQKSSGVADGLFCREIDGLFCRSSPDIIVRRRCVLSHKRRGWLQPSPSFRYSRNLALQDELYHPVINNGPAVLVCVDKRLGTGPVNQSRDAG